MGNLEQKLPTVVCDVANLLEKAHHDICHDTEVFILLRRNLGFNNLNKEKPVGLLSLVRITTLVGFIRHYFVLPFLDLVEQGAVL